ncbi:MAG: 5-formyltetrahydrofolate cyclo-ligase [Clostridiaceae bacterium]|nr:5-formyltetrahydrofolate cyclo-ligase [Clostridiaceae bacterium]
MKKSEQMNKSELREYIFKLRNSLSDINVQNASSKISAIIKDLSVFTESSLILSYMPYGKEVNVLPLNKFILEHGKELCIPRVINNMTMDAVRINNLEENLVKGHFGILQPKPSLESVNIDEIDLILVPGLGFDLHGNRLGHGKGYYDRFLEKCPEKTFTIGIAYDMQVFDTIPHYPHDVKLKALVTESGYYTF